MSILLGVNTLKISMKRVNPPPQINDLLIVLVIVIAVLFTVQRRTPWAQSMSDMAFVHLCCVLCQSRWRWHQTPCPPFDITQHCKLATTIDAFLEAADDKDWWDCDHLFFTLPEDKADFEGAEDDEEDEEGQDGGRNEGDVKMEGLEDGEDTENAATTASMPAPSMDMTGMAEALEKDLAREKMAEEGDTMDLD
ncbi:hypothetical protein F5B19DRAFT_446813 [Rostrohypoxylon terebratum]|nr:hypothetical protein F5B19DRAFT_446813 [Rostrohypoxylon terebratum]